MTATSTDVSEPPSWRSHWADWGTGPDGSLISQDSFLMRTRRALAYALQPIVNIHTGGVYGYEALLRGVTELGFRDVYGFLDQAWEWGYAKALDGALREMAIGRFAELPDAGRYRLFFNLEPRLLELENPSETLSILSRHGLGPDSLCLELSERAELTANHAIAGVIAAYRRARVQFAIDDFGTGFSGLRLLYEHPPTMLKIDRFFVSGMGEDRRKRLFVANTVQLAHSMGINVVAEGVETECELRACRDAGCDLVQGYFIERPQLRIDVLRKTYPQLREIHLPDRRDGCADFQLMTERLEALPALPIDAGIDGMFEAFRRNTTCTAIPVVDAAQHPLGLIHEVDIKELIYSRYGRDLIANSAFARGLSEFVRPCSIVDTHASADRLVTAFSVNANPAGLIVTQDGRYLGVLSAMSLLQLVEEKNLAQARDQNPLTKLPGNSSIHEYVSRVLLLRECTCHLVYLDFDHFKAFNDHYGFRLGDRAILMFAELMRKRLGSSSWFIGHIGGDDFFAGIQDADRADVVEQVQCLLRQFRSDVQSLYDPDDRRRGHLRTMDRYGEGRETPLMRCSGALLEIGVGEDFGSADGLSRVIATMKDEAKQSHSGLVFRSDPDPRGTTVTISDSQDRHPFSLLRSA